MQYLVNNRIYNTENAEKIISYSKSSEINRVGYLTIYKKYKHTLYKTKKFCDIKYICDQNCESCIIQYFEDEIAE